jgi:hypothetical protein
VVNVLPIIEEIERAGITSHNANHSAMDKRARAFGQSVVSRIVRAAYGTTQTVRQRSKHLHSAAWRMACHLE